MHVKRSQNPKGTAPPAPTSSERGMGRQQAWLAGQDFLLGWYRRSEIRYPSHLKSMASFFKKNFQIAYQLLTLKRVQLEGICWWSRGSPPRVWVHPYRARLVVKSSTWEVSSLWRATRTKARHKSLEQEDERGQGKKRHPDHTHILAWPTHSTRAGNWTKIQGRGPVKNLKANIWAQE